MVVKDRFGSLTVYRGELYSGHSDDKLGETFFGIIWLNDDNSRARAGTTSPERSTRDSAH